MDNEPPRKKKFRSKEAAQRRSKAKEAKKREKIQEKRKNDDFRLREQIANKERMTSLRSNNQYKEREQSVNKERMTSLRSNDHYKEREQSVNKERMTSQRSNDQYKEREQSVNKERMTSLRSNDQYKEREQSVNKERMTSLRSNDQYKSREQSVNKERMTSLRHDTNYSNKEADRRKHWIEKDITYQDLIVSYEEHIKEGPTYICLSCSGLFFRSGVKYTHREDLTKEVEESLLIQILDFPLDEWICLCITCNRYIQQKKIPRLCEKSGLSFPTIPDIVKRLNTIEERLVAPRLPFMQIRQLGIDRQLGIRGNVVNVPVSVDVCIQSLPRSFDESETCQLRLKRMMAHKSDYMFESIRPKVVHEAVLYLLTQPLYIEEGITLSVDWLQNHDGVAENFVLNAEDIKAFDGDNETEHQTIDDFDETLNEEKVSPGAEETLLKEGIEFAPGEGKTPISIFSEHCEELSFPTIYGGQRFNTSGIKLTYAEIAKYKLRHKDRRCTAVPHIFFSYRKKEMEALRKAINICMKKAEGPKGRIKASEVLDHSVINELIKNDDAYRVLLGDRSSPAFWGMKQKQVMAMIRQLGIPTFFLTLSAAETHWPELMVILVKVIENRDITEEEASQMNYMEKCNLIRKDPVICSQYFDRRFRELFKLMKNKVGPFAPFEILDYFLRIEFQHRGSPHVHALLWIKDSPKYIKSNIQSRKECQDFISQFISCTSIGELTRLQYHKHSKSCKKTLRDRAICRFGIPYFPMRETIVLDPLEDMDISLKEDVGKIMSGLKALDKRVTQKDPTIEKESVNDFLVSIGLQEDAYCLAIRSTLKKSTVFLKRKPSEIRINGFNRDILERHRANMDLQFILDPYGCVHYILNYINKSNRGISKLLKEVVDETKAGYLSHQQRLQKICSKFLNCSEVSAQEAVYILLSMPLTMCSRTTIFINTGEKEHRTKIMKKVEELEQMDPESTDIMALGLLDYYSNRPEEMNLQTLSEFAANYNISKTNKTKVEDDSSTEDNEGTISSKAIKVFDQTTGKILCWLKERKQSKVIRYRRYQQMKDELNFYREKVMLFVPWRDEETELINVDIKAKYMFHLKEIQEIENKFINNKNVDYELIRQEMENNLNEEETEDIDYGAPDYIIHDLERKDYQINQDMNRKNESIEKCKTFLIPKVLADDSYALLLRKLNSRQRIYILELMSRVKTSPDPLYHFITGGAGTGKSLLIDAIYQCLSRYYSSRFGKPDDIKVLLTAPTGKAAFNIGGTTLHSALKLTVNEKACSGNMSPETKNSLKSQLWYLQVIIIDEVSMVGSKMLTKIDHQLRQIFDTKKKFGGISILFFGDFNQLRPVLDSYIFETPSHSQYAVIAGNELWKDVQLFKLTEIMRQKDDMLFANALNNLANNQLTDEDISLFKSRVFKENDDIIPSKAIRLFAMNSKVNDYNHHIITTSTEKLYISSKVDSTNADLPVYIRQSVLESMNSLSTTATGGLANIVELKRGVRYMITANIDISDGLVNGSTGILKEVETSVKDDQMIPQRLWLDFESSNVGSIARSRHPLRQSDGIILTPLTRISRDITRKHGNRFIPVTRSQFPLIPAEAITIHKSQGQTYKEVVVHMVGRMELSQVYTAFSRATNANGLFIVTEEFKIPIVGKKGKTTQEMERLERDCCINYKLTNLAALTFPPTVLKLYFHNFPFLAKHVLDILCDANVKEADILAIVETRSHRCQIPGYQLKFEIPFTGGRPFGISIYLKFGIDASLIRQAFDEENGGHYEFIDFKIQGIRFLILYVSPKLPKNGFIEALVEECNTNEKTIVVGDFNINVSTGHRLLEAMESIGFELKSKGPSTDSQTQIDLCFANFDLELCVYYESLLSFHKPILAII